jgi:predicted nucleic acid-binding protein
LAALRSFISLLEGLSIEIDADTFTHVLSDTLQLSRRYRLSSYDASYLELALRNGGPIAALDDDEIGVIVRANTDLRAFC